MTISEHKHWAAVMGLLERGDLCQFNRGIERETLRADEDGLLSRQPHPDFLGSKLCHPTITTDFSESQLELITTVSSDLQETLEALDAIHRFVYTGLEDELLWCASMPCKLPPAAEIPLANYGTSNLGQLKTTYRHGLGIRYGRTMQTICAVHYNFSFSEDFWAAAHQSAGTGEDLTTFKSRRYFDLMRNFRRYSWLAIYLFGASPVVSRSFLSRQDHVLQPFSDVDLYAPFGTSLRNGDLGYQSDTQANALHICYNSLENYVNTLVNAVTTPHPEYAPLGIREGEKFIQVSGNILQSEAEFYTTIRAKCVPPPGENFLAELTSKGVEYLEVRLLDANPYLPLGIDARQARFLDTMLVYCLLCNSPDHDDDLCNAVRTNAHQTVYEGRNPALKLDDDGEMRLLSEWGKTLLEEMKPVAEALDRAQGISDHQDSLKDQLAKINNPQLTPSAQLLDEMSTSNLSFREFTIRKSQQHQRYFQSRALTAQQLADFKQMSVRSVTEQQQLERADTMGFSEYLEQRLQSYIHLEQGQ